MDKEKILIVEDEEDIASIEKMYLEHAGYTVTIARDGAQGLSYFEREPFDLLILDLMVPYISGEELLQKIRSSSDVPIIIVSAKSEENDRIQNLCHGADDFMVKPFSARELVARVQAILRRQRAHIAYEESSNILSADGRLRIQNESMQVWKDEECIHLTKNEFSILHTLFSHPNKVFTRDEIIEIAFGMDYEAFDRAIDTHIKNIRQKIEDDPRHPVYICTVYGVGYRAGAVNEA